MTKQLFRSLIPGDETSQPQETKLTDKEVQRAVVAVLLREKISVLEVDLRDARLQLQQVQDACSHHVFYDTACFPYDHRYCGICGVYRGML